MGRGRERCTVIWDWIILHTWPLVLNHGGTPRFSRVILNGQFGCGGGGAGAGRGAVDAWWRRGGHKGHDSLKFEKDGSLAKCASGATKIDC